MNTAKRQLPVFDVQDPCQEDWSQMQVVGPYTRHCGLCAQNVYEISGMSTAEAEQLLRQNSVCVRFYRRADGTVATADCEPVRVRALRKLASGSLKVGARLMAFALAFLAFLGVTRASSDDVYAWVRKSPIGKVLPTLEVVHRAPTEDMHVMGGAMAPEPTPEQGEQ